MASTHEPAARGRRRFSPLLWISSLLAMLILALGINGTLGQLTASITNTTNEIVTAAATAFQFSEALLVGGTPSAPCVTAQAGATEDCATINKYGDDGVLPSTPIPPGGSKTTSVRLSNDGTGPGAFSGTLGLTVAPCTQTPDVSLPTVGDLCAAATVAVACTTDGDAGADITIASGSLTAFAAGAPYAIATLDPTEIADCTFTVTQPSDDANLQGITLSQPMSWTFTQFPLPAP